MRYSRFLISPPDCSTNKSQTRRERHSGPSFLIVWQVGRKRENFAQREGISTNKWEARSEVARTKDDDEELIQRWHCRATPLQFAIITFPGKWIALVARCIPGRSHGRDCIGDFAIRLYGPRYDPYEKFVWWPIKLSGIRVSVAR